MSSSSQAARGSPSRGWPTLPGLSSQPPLARSSSGAVAGLGALGRRRGSPLGGAGEEEGDVGVADQPDPLLLRVEPRFGLLEREHVLPDRVARRGVEEADPGAARRAARGRAGTSSVGSRDSLPGPARPRPPRSRRRSRCRARPAPPGRGCRPGRARSARGSAPRRRRARPRSRPRRRGTRSPRPRPPRPPRGRLRGPAVGVDVAENGYAQAASVAAEVAGPRSHTMGP